MFVNSCRSRQVALPVRALPDARNPPNAALHCERHFYCKKESLDFQAKTRVINV